MYKYGKWSINNDIVEISLEGCAFTFADMSRETQEQIKQEIMIGKTEGDIVEINEPFNDEERNELLHRSTEIQSVLENNLFEKEDEFILVSERDQIDNILEQ